MPFADISAVVEEDRLGIAPTALRHEAPNVRAPIRRESSAERPRRNPFRMVLPEDRVGPRPVTVRLVRLAAEHVVRHAGLLDVLREFLGRLHRDDGLADRPGLLRPPGDEGHALLRRKVREPEVHDVRRTQARVVQESHDEPLLRVLDPLEDGRVLLRLDELRVRRDLFRRTSDASVEALPLQVEVYADHRVAEGVLPELRREPRLVLLDGLQREGPRSEPSLEPLRLAEIEAY